MPTVEEIMWTTDSRSRTMCVPSLVGHRALAGADRPGVEHLAVVGDSHFVGGQVDDGYVAVTDDERRRYSPAPRPPRRRPSR